MGWQTGRQTVRGVQVCPNGRPAGRPPGHRRAKGTGRLFPDRSGRPRRVRSGPGRARHSRGRLRPLPVSRRPPSGPSALGTRVRCPVRPAGPPGPTDPPGRPNARTRWDNPLPGLAGPAVPRVVNCEDSMRKAALGRGVPCNGNLGSLGCKCRLRSIRGLGDLTATSDRGCRLSGAPCWGATVT